MSTRYKTTYAVVPEATGGDIEHAVAGPVEGIAALCEAAAGLPPGRYEVFWLTDAGDWLRWGSGLVLVPGGGGVDWVIVSDRGLVLVPGAAIV